MVFTHLVQTVGLVFFMSVFSGAQGPATETPAGRQLAGWLAAYDGMLTANFCKRTLLRRPVAGSRTHPFVIVPAVTISRR